MAASADEDAHGTRRVWTIGGVILLVLVALVVGRVVTATRPTPPTTADHAGWCRDVKGLTDMASPTAVLGVTKAELEGGTAKPSDRVSAARLYRLMGSRRADPKIATAYDDFATYLDAIEAGTVTPSIRQHGASGAQQVEAYLATCV